jgi:hypothetical protein
MVISYIARSCFSNKQLLRSDTHGWLSHSAFSCTGALQIDCRCKFEMNLCCSCLCTSFVLRLCLYCCIVYGYFHLLEYPFILREWELYSLLTFVLVVSICNLYVCIHSITKLFQIGKGKHLVHYIDKLVYFLTPSS